MGADGDLAFFALLARRESFTATARELGVSTSAVSRRLARLEDRLGVRLLNRTTRRVSLTGEGDAYLLAATRILAEIEAIEEEIAASRKSPRGLMRINGTFGFGRAHLAPAISEFVSAYPELEVQLHLTDAPLNLVEEGFDLGVRFGSPPTSRLVRRRLLRNRRMLCACPAYLERRGVPERLADLRNHNCIILRQEHDSYETWRFGGEEDSMSMKVRGDLSTNDGEIALGWVLDGHGIMLRSEWDIARHVRDGRLNIVLPQHMQPAHIFAVYPERHNLSAKVRLFIDFLSRRLQAAACSYPLAVKL